MRIVSPFRFVLKHIAPLTVGYLFIGIAFGVLAVEAGHSVLWTFLAGLLIYAGSMQIVMISLMLSGVPLYAIAFMTFFVNARHIFYGLGFVERFRGRGWMSPYLALTVTDETYSVLCSIEYPPEMDSRKADLCIAATCHLLWAFSCLAGALFGRTMPFDMRGIEFSATAFFTTICVDQWRRFGSHIPAVAGFLAAIAFYGLLGPDRFLLPALSASLIVLLVLKDRVALGMGGGAS